MPAGLKLAVAPEGRPLADNAIAASKLPEMLAVMVDCPEPSGATVKAFGFADSEKPGAPPDVMVRLPPAVDVTPPPVPLRVKEYVPAVAPAPTVRVRLDDPDPGAAMLDGLKPAVTPAGKPLADNEIAELKLSKT